jgi:prevent-host-death family protein
MFLVANAKRIAVQEHKIRAPVRFFRWHATHTPTVSGKSVVVSPSDMAIIAMTGGNRMRSVNVAELKNSLSRYLTYAKQGEEIVVRDRNLPVAKIVPLSVDETSKDELILVAAGKLRLPQAPLDIHKLLKIRTGRVRASQAIQALVDERAEGR